MVAAVVNIDYMCLRWVQLQRVHLPVHTQRFPLLHLPGSSTKVSPPTILQSCIIQKQCMYTRMPGRPHLIAKEVVDLLDFDRENRKDLEEDDLLEVVDFDEIICPWSDDDLASKKRS